MALAFRNTAGFGRRMEYWIIGKMLHEGLDVYVPLVDDFGIDAVVRKQNDTFIEIQIKARSKDVAEGSAALFAAIHHPVIRKNYYFVFYSERLDATWIMSSADFIDEAVKNSNGTNAGKRSIWFNGNKKDRTTGRRTEYPKPRYDKYRVSDFSIFRRVTGLIATSSSDQDEQHF